VVVEVPFVQSARNRPALDFLRAAGAQFADAGSVFRFPAEHAAGLTYHPARTAKAASVRAAPAPGGAAVRKEIDFVRIANELGDVVRILVEIRAERRERTASNGRAAAAESPRTELESRLAAIWADLLGLPSVGVQDNFFDLGGHSLLAVQLLSRVRQELGVEVSLEVVYEGAFTVSELAKTIEIQQILGELEGLSDEEVRALLAQQEEHG
jgi:acyl carrier protein